MKCTLPRAGQTWIQRCFEYKITDLTPKSLFWQGLKNYNPPIEQNLNTFYRTLIIGGDKRL